MEMTRVFWSALLAVVGLLTTGSAGQPFMVEYGAPHVHYTLSGRTVARGTGAPIRGIRVRLNGVRRASALSDSAGKWLLIAEAVSPCGRACTMTAIDPDGPANGGAFDSLTVRIAPRQTRPRSEGAFEQSGIVFELHEAVRK